MIEVEKKFILKEGDEARLINGAKFIGEKAFTDSYYDDKDYSLTTKDVWLRGRDGKLELKVPFNDSIEERISDQYQELVTDEEIAQYLKLPIDQPLLQALEEKGYAQFCTLTTTRRKYKKEDFVIDIDDVDFGYEIAEIECMVEESSIKEATQKIVEYAKQIGLTEGIVRGKVAEYLRRKNPAHFQALIDAKVIK